MIQKDWNLANITLISPPPLKYVWFVFTLLGVLYFQFLLRMLLRSARIHCKYGVETEEEENFILRKTKDATGERQERRSKKRIRSCWKNGFRAASKLENRRGSSDIQNQLTCDFTWGKTTSQSKKCKGSDQGKRNETLFQRVFRRFWITGFTIRVRRQPKENFNWVKCGQQIEHRLFVCESSQFEKLIDDINKTSRYSTQDCNGKFFSPLLRCCESSYKRNHF